MSLSCLYRFCFLFVGLLILPRILCANEHNFFVNDPPNWVVHQSYSETQKPDLIQPQRYYLIDRQFNFRDGRHQHYYRQVRSPLNSVGVEQASEIQIVYNSDYESLIMHNISIIRGGSTRDVTQSESPRFIQQEPEMDNLIHTGLTTAVYHLKDVRVGDIIDFSYTVEGKNPIFGKKPFGVVTTNWSVEVDRFRFQVIADTTLDLKSYNTSTKIKSEVADGKYIYSYQESPVAAVINEDNYPPDVTPYAFIAYTSYKNWASVNRWAANLYENQVASSELKTIARQLWASNPNQKDYTMAALNFVQNEIRYLGLEFGENTHRPHPVSDILDSRFGDCKDKSVLLMLLLKEKGIESYPALVNTKVQGLINKLLPSPGSFDHVINLVILDGEHYWLDGTAKYQQGSIDTIGRSDYGYSLVVGFHNRELVDMFDYRPLANKVIVDESFSFEEYGGDITYKVKTQYFNRSAEYQRFRFANTSVQKIDEEYIRFYQTFYPKIVKTKDVITEDDPVENKLVVYEEYLIQDNWKENEYRYEIPVNLVYYGYYLPKLTSVERRLPFYIGQPSLVEGRFTINYPDSVDLNFPNSSKVYDEPSFRYEISDSYKNKVYTHKSSLEIKSDRVMPEDLLSYSEVREKLFDQWFFTIFSPKPDLFEGYDKIVQLKHRLKALEENYREQ